jgi:hypothetical protein
MGLAARKKYEQLFTPRAVLPLLTDFYEQMVNGRATTNNGKRHPREGGHPWAHLRGI